MDLWLFLLKSKFTGEDWEAIFSPAIYRLQNDILAEAKRRDSSEFSVQCILSAENRDLDDHVFSEVTGALADLIKFQRIEVIKERLLDAYEIGIWPYRQTLAQSEKVRALVLEFVTAK